MLFVICECTCECTCVLGCVYWVAQGAQQLRLAPNFLLLCRPAFSNRAGVLLSLTNMQQHTPTRAALAPRATPMARPTPGSLKVICASAGGGWSWVATRAMKDSGRDTSFTVSKRCVCTNAANSCCLVRCQLSFSAHAHLATTTGQGKWTLAGSATISKQRPVFFSYERAHDFPYTQVRASIRWRAARATTLELSRAGSACAASWCCGAGSMNTAASE